MALQIYFGSADLSNFFSEFSETIVNRFGSTRVPQRHGLVIEAPTVSTKILTLTGAVHGVDHNAVRAAVGSVTGELGRKGLDKLRVYDDRFIECHMANVSLRVEGATGMTRGDLAVSFRADNIPFWQSDMSVSSVTQQITSGDSMAFTNSGPVDTPFRATITNDHGSTMNLVQFVLQNSSTWSYTGAWEDGETIVVDSRSFSVTNEGVNDFANWSGEFFELPTGANIISVICDGNADIGIEFNPRWYTY